MSKTHLCDGHQVRRCTYKLILVASELPSILLEGGANANWWSGYATAMYLAYKITTYCMYVYRTEINIQMQ